VVPPLKSQNAVTSLLIVERIDQNTSNRKDNEAQDKFNQCPIH